jgi:hypothetical protein
MDIRQVNQAIMFGQFTTEELNSIIDAVKWNRASLSKRVKAGLRVGDRVSFTSSKTGMKMVGDITKIAIKYVTVRVGATLWRCPANMLTVEDREFA